MKENILEIPVSEVRKLEELDEKLIELYNMEVDDDKFITVEDMVIGMGECLKDDEFEYSWETLKSEINEFKQYLDKHYYTSLCIDCEHGGCFGMGYCVVNNNLEYVGFIRTI